VVPLRIRASRPTFRKSYSKKEVVLPDVNTIYVVVFRGDIRFSVSKGYGFSYFGEDWCGYHTGFYLIGDRVSFYKVIVVGDASTSPNPMSCMQFTNNADTVNKNAGADSLVSVYAHEIAEVITNPLVGSMQPNYTHAWTFKNGSRPRECGGYDICEVGDPCNFNFGTDNNSNMLVGKKRFLIQGTWQKGFGCTIYKIKK